MMRGLFGPGTLVLGAGAILLSALLAIGFILPKEWRAEVSRTFPSTSAEVLPLLNGPEGWRQWTTWPDSVESFGPNSGAGAGMSWTDREFGSGRFEIQDADAGSVRYSVSVEGAGGSVMRTRGSIELARTGSGTQLSWTEEGDLGRNPLMGWWGLSMGRLQSVEMEKSLNQLAELLEDRDSATSDSLPTR